MNRRIVLNSIGAILTTPIIGCLNVQKNQDKNNTNEEYQPNQSEENLNKSADNNSDPDVIAAPRGIAGIIGYLLDESPDDAPIHTWNEIEQTSLLQELVKKALDPDNREETTRGDLTFEYVEIVLFSDSEPGTTNFVLQELEYYHNKENAYPTGWYIKHPNQLFAFTYIVYN